MSITRIAAAALATAVCAAAPLVGATAAHAATTAAYAATTVAYAATTVATTTPMHCAATVNPNNPALALLGIHFQEGEYGGLDCQTVPNRDPRVNLCATQVIDHGLFAVGHLPKGTTCP